MFSDKTLNQAHQGMKKWLEEVKRVTNDFQAGRRFSEVVKQLREKGAADITVIGGGIIPEEDIPQLKQAGIKEVFLPGTPLSQIIEWTNENVKPLNRLSSSGK